ERARARAVPLERLRIDRRAARLLPRRERPRGRARAVPQDRAVNESQRRAFRALGIGPLWHRRTGSAQAAASSDGGTRSFFLLSDEAGDWLFVGEIDDADAAGDAGAGSS